MTPPDVDRRIFVVGVPRSGTTLVQSLLAAHSQVTSFTESHFFSRCFRPLPRWSAAILTRDPVPRLREFLAENDVEPGAAAALEERVARALPRRWLWPFASRAVARRLLGILDQLARLRGTSSWIEKTPRHLRYLPFVERLSGAEPRPHFVHVIRGGLETVASLYTASRSWERPYDLDTCVARWNADVGFSLGRVLPKGGKRNTAPNDHFVFYEELTSRPEITLERLLADLDLDWEPEILERYARGSQPLITCDETWKEDIGRGIRRSSTSGRVLTEEQRGRVRAALRHDLYTRLLEWTSAR